MTAEELKAQLAADPEFLEQERQRERIRQQHAEALARAEGPVVAALREAGFNVTSIYDLVNATDSYTRALPLLLQHLQLPYAPLVREGIARALAVPEAKFAWKTLLSLFRNDFDQKANGVKWAIGCALAAAADDEVMPDVIELFENSRHGENRLAFVDALKQSRRADARAALEKARQDPQLAREMRRLLGRPRKV
jgi:hypothetical protein